MITGSHNSWTYLRPRRWWMRLIRWTARCQSATIGEQYGMGVRCFDLRIKFTDGNLKLAHGIVEYDYTMQELGEDLAFLDKMGDCKVRVLHEIRRKGEQTEEELFAFRYGCQRIRESFPHITFFCGRNLVDWKVDYDFGNPEYTIEDAYGSVLFPKTIFALWPRLSAWVFNNDLYVRGTDKEILLMDFVKKR